jgi:ATP-dependent Clp endopeptidase proteolytic subunit ClpP
MKRWFTMKLNDNETGEIMIYDMIGKDPWTGEGMDATDFDTELKALGAVKNINLRINSPGGDVFDGLAIFNMIKNHPATVTASVDGIAASAASLIAMAADKIVMPENSFMLIHKPRGMVFGTDDDMVSMAGDLERMGATFSNAYAARTGQKAEDVTALMCEDRLMSATEAKSLGYADDLSSPVKMAAAYDLKRLPEKARAVMTAAVAADEPEVVVPAVVEPVVVDPVVEPVVEPAVIVAYGDADIHATLDLCLLANCSGKASAFIKAKTPITKVREQLLAARASASDALDVDTVPPITPEAHLNEWRGLQARVKAEMGIGKRK